jgi:hypothetical protein
MEKRDGANDLVSAAHLASLKNDKRAKKKTTNISR